jgi:SMC interacting uncharacterized protein involved in chromosome segregation
MTKPIHVLEDELCCVYEQQADKYEAALRIGVELADTYADSREACETLRRLTEVLDEIARLDQRISETRSCWTALQRRPGARLKQVLDRLEQLIRGTIDAISRAEGSARQARSRLLPELGREALGQKMRQAYGAACQTE